MMDYYGKINKLHKIYNNQVGKNHQVFIITNFLYLITLILIISNLNNLDLILKFKLY